MDEGTEWDAIVVGGGPAGLSGALWLARYRRRVLVVDAEDPRNAPTWAVHGYFGIEDPKPMELRELGRRQATDAGACYRAGVVDCIEGQEDDFRVRLEDGSTHTARRILLCTGLKDILPEIEGFQELYGTSIWHCPDCDGPTIKDLNIGVIGWGDSIVKYCLYMLTWTDRITILLHGHEPDMSPDALAALERFGIQVRPHVIERLEGSNGCLRSVVFVRDDQGTATDAEEFDALFFHIACGPGSTLAADLGCELEPGGEMDGILLIDRDHATSVPGVYAAGDITPGSRLSLRAAAEGARAAVGIHKSLIPDDRRF
ncbi:MAG TPA: NAD(P)/FAD-dependent oxidoreductase [Longimicrobiaceae bacterium]|nr:NAD(P)/FAD-dependent oxidoreductase [Longimicrobiaceae bacterium]